MRRSNRGRDRAARCVTDILVFVHSTDVGSVAHLPALPCCSTGHPGKAVSSFQGTSLDSWIIPVVLQLSTTAAHWHLGGGMKRMSGRKERKISLWCILWLLLVGRNWVALVCLWPCGGAAIMSKVPMCQQKVKRSQNSKTNQYRFSSKKLKDYCKPLSFRSSCRGIFSTLCCSPILETLLQLIDRRDSSLPAVSPKFCSSTAIHQRPSLSRPQQDAMTS